jgi:putative nucleotidyltransferase with HDIG domain
MVMDKSMVTIETIKNQKWWKEMENCPQDPRHHGEGDVATHTQMVYEAIQKDERYQASDAITQYILRLAAFLHDMGKVATTKVESDGSITSHGHARTGAQMARRFLWEQGVDFKVRESVCALVRWHMRPAFLLMGDYAVSKLLTIAQTCRCDWLEILSTADTNGRICGNAEEMLLRVALFGEMAREWHCYKTPFAFASDHSRFCYFRTRPEVNRDPNYLAHDDTKGEMILMSGMPGAGKDTYVQKYFSHLPVVSLDAIRKEHKIAPSAAQEGVIGMSVEKAKGYLRAGQSFVWNATNLRYEIRERPVNLAATYGFRVGIVAIEASHTRLFAQNKSREAIVPQAVMERYLDRWELPDLTEAHHLDYIV